MPDESLKCCRLCGIEKPLSGFHRNRAQAGGVRRECKACVKQLDADRHAANRNTANTRRLKHYYDNREQTLTKRKVEGVRRRITVLVAYGGVCACCGEDRWPFLTIDHIDGDGAAHRLEIGSNGSALYRWLIREGFPPGYQVLCWNCNLSKHQHGQCAHQLTLIHGTAVGTASSLKELLDART